MGVEYIFCNHLITNHGNYQRAYFHSGASILFSDMRPKNPADPGNSPPRLENGDINTWKMIISGETQTLVGKDPLFVAISQKDFHIQTTSPAVNKGKPLPEISDDRDAQPRSDGKPDIGSDESD